MIDWRSYSPARLLRRNAGIFIDNVHKAIQETYDRSALASGAYYPNAAADDALPYLAADAFLPAYGTETPTRIANRLMQRNQILTEAGTLPCIARIVSLYFPSSARVLVVSRAGYYAQRIAGAATTGKLAFAFDWDSAAYATAPSDRQNDTFIFVEGPFDFTLPSLLILQASTSVLNPSNTVGALFAAPAGRDVFGAIRVALKQHTSVWTTVREMVLIDPTQPTNTYFNLASSGTFPTGQYGRWGTRPTIHRYAGEMT